MALNSSKKAIIKHRREWIARLRLRGLSQREIVDKLASEDIVNTATGEPFSLATVNADLQVLEQEWRNQAIADTGTLKGRALAELREARRVAWENKQLTIVLRALAQEVQLLDLQGQVLNSPAVSAKSFSPHEDRGDLLSEQINSAIERASDEEKAALSAKLEAFMADIASVLGHPGALSNKDL